MDIIEIASWIIVGLIVLALLSMVISITLSIINNIDRNNKIKKFNERMDKSFDELITSLKKNTKEDGVVKVPKEVNLAKTIIKKPITKKPKAKK